MNKLIAGATIASLALGLTGCASRHHDAPQTPDYTVAQCSVWADTANPVLPPYTRTDVCVEPDGTLSYAPVDAQLPTV